MREEQHFLLASSWQDAFRICQRAGGKRAVDHGLILAWAQTLECALAQAETPLTPIVAGAVGYPVLVRRDGKQSLLQLLQRQGDAHRLRIIEDMQIVRAKVDDPAPFRIADPCILDIPLRVDFPVEHFGAAGNFVPLELDTAVDELERLTHPSPGDAAANRVELRRECMQVVADGIGRCFHVGCARKRRHSSDSYCSRSKSGQCASRSEISLCGSGHWIAKAGSFQRTPAASSGAK